MRTTSVCLLVRNQLRQSYKRAVPLLAYVPHTQLSKQEWKKHVKDSASRELFVRTRPYVDYIATDGV